VARTLGVAGLLIVFAWLGCSTVRPVAPDAATAAPVSGTSGCQFVVRGDRAVWWTAGYGTDLFETDQRTHEVLAHVAIPAGSSVTDVAVGFGSVWLANGGHRPTVYRIEQGASRLVADIELASLLGSKGKRAYVAAGEGALWATVNVLDTLLRIDPDEGTITDAIPIGSTREGGIRLGRVTAGEGAVWVLHDSTVSRIDPDTRRVVARITVPGLGFGIGEVITGGGTVWVAAGSTLTRIDPLTNTVVATIPVVLDPAAPPNRSAVGHMAVAGGTLWALAFQSLGSFSRPTAVRYALVAIDTDTNSVRTTRWLGAGDAAGLFFGPTLAATDDALWVCQPTGLYTVPLGSSH